jgi:Na+-driven multidrug efflux pump
VKAFRDPLYIRILSGLFFACAFIWVAIRYFQVDVNVIWVFLIMSVIFVAGLIVLGLVFSVVLRLLRRRAADDEVPVSAETDSTQNRQP